MKRKKLNFKHLWIQFEDFLFPRLRLSVTDRAVYSHLIRHSRLEGQLQLRFSMPWLARGIGISTAPVRESVRRLVVLGALRLIRRTKAGHIIAVRLPAEIRGLRPGLSAVAEPTPLCATPSPTRTPTPRRHPLLPASSPLPSSTPTLAAAARAAQPALLVGTQHCCTLLKGPIFLVYPELRGATAVLPPKGALALRRGHGTPCPDCLYLLKDEYRLHLIRVLGALLLIRQFR